MKNPTQKLSLVLFFCVILLNGFAQTKGLKVKKPVKAATDTVLQHKVDSLAGVIKATGKKVDSAKQVTSNANAKADAINKTVNATKDSLAKAGKSKDTTGVSQYIGKTYIFKQNFKLTECASDGESVTHPTTPVAIRGNKFLITGSSGNKLVILFYIWGLKKESQENSTIIKSMIGQNGHIDLNSLDTTQRKVVRNNEAQFFLQTETMAKRKTFNFKNDWDEQFAPNTLQLDSLNSNRYYFLLPTDSLKKYCVADIELKYWSINFGSIVTPFKLRFNRFSFSDNLSVGGAAFYQRKMKKDTNFTWGIVGALSLSSVTLDQSSTNITPALTNSTNRPAVSPSLSYVISYKSINFMAGMGFDFISKPSMTASAANPEVGWIYNGKPWLGIGFGVSLFNSNNSKAGSPPPSAGQNNSATSDK